jgi:hypothetical protein
VWGGPGQDPDPFSLFVTVRPGNVCKSEHDPMPLQQCPPLAYGAGSAKTPQFPSLLTALSLCAEVTGGESLDSRETTMKIICDDLITQLTLTRDFFWGYFPDHCEYVLSFRPSRLSAEKIVTSIGSGAKKAFGAFVYSAEYAFISS